MRPATGVWLIGARGSVATTAIAGAAMIGRELVPPTGCVTELETFRAADLPGLGDLAFGGHDVVTTPLRRRAEALAADGVLPAAALDRIGDAVDAADLEIRPGAMSGATEPQAAVATRLAADIADFRARRKLERVVVVNVASTEPPAEPSPAHASIAALDAALATEAAVLPPSSLYAYAAFSAGCAFVDFTPSTGARLPALDELARMRGVPYAGSDGKTGETLMKSVLGPMFATRSLRVRSWSGTNLLGGGDGANLVAPGAFSSKRRSKQRTLHETLGYDVDGDVHIDYVPDLGEWKTAWDHITFDGFLGVRMHLQFTWQGCDSTLAAPLVLDLARLASAAHRAGETGPLGPLAFFFKDPVGRGAGSLSSQFDELCRWATSLVPAPAAGSPAEAARIASTNGAVTPADLDAGATPTPAPARGRAAGTRLR